ncbi:hypothetical protein FYK55_27745 [Roseiconus nitratireducens]|uniref:DUF7309 domain-containing protein n=1 Tax=Roseiconus nitratireducens TaxID=2605748 RepID=A0A5M6CS45_9BACT|nr:hypothetical protein [Roseiconus nitratireducens]KAA5538014.1 hypothetical protein FYK55_27745 [Roseiconus nitratireducens]
MSTAIERFLSYAVQPGAQWQGGVFDFAEIVGGPLADTPMAEAKVALWVSCELEIVQGKPSIEGTSFELLISELLELLETNHLGYRPALISVTNKDLAMQLKERLSGSGTEVTWDAEPEFWCEVRDDMANHFSEFAAASLAPSLASSGCSGSQIRAFSEAAAAFYQARPWRFLDDTDLLKIQTPKPPKYLKHATVLGAGGREFGLGFYDSAETHWGMRAQRLDMGSLAVFSLTFSPISEAIEEDVAYWNDHNLPLATGDAFPQFLFYSREETRAPKPKELEFLTIVLAALAETSEEEMDSGEWSKQVAIQGKNRRCKISIPDLLEPPARTEWIDRGLMPDQRGNERHFRLIQSVMAQNKGMDVDQLNELLNTQYTGSIDDFDYPSATPFDRAENLYYAAIDTYGRRRIQLARQALQEDPSHIEANVLLADSTHDAAQRIDRFTSAVELAESDCDDLLKSEVGRFWEISKTRPLIRAKHGLAISLASDGQANEAISEMLDILRLNQNDNLGVRYEVIPLLLRQNREQEASDVLNQYPEESGPWLYLKAQVEYRAKGPNSPNAQRAMANAFKFNPHVVELLMDETPPMAAEQYTLGSPEEAAMVIEDQQESWMETDGFVEWMFARFAVWQRELLQRKRRASNAKRKKRTK